MFEDSFVSMRVDRAAAGRTRWLLVGSLLIQGAVAGLMFALPMLHPERLVARVPVPTVFVPIKPVVPPNVAAREISRSPLTAAMTQLTRVIECARTNPARDGTRRSGSGPAGGDGRGVFGSSNARRRRARRGGRRNSWNPRSGSRSGEETVRVSAGVTAGLLLEPIRPAYPAIAKAAHVSGEVVVAATISPEGRIEGLRVVSGPAMLRESAMEAIRRARYRPFLLNGEPTAVETTVTVDFRIGS